MSAASRTNEPAGASKPIDMDQEVPVRNREGDTWKLEESFWRNNMK